MIELEYPEVDEDKLGFRTCLISRICKKTKKQ